MGKKGGRNAAFAGGYNEVTAAKLANVNLPVKLKCDVCSKWKSNANFSKNQLDNLRYKISKFGNVGAPKAIKCRVCTGGQLVELECAMCGEFKGLDDFAKSQRHQGDAARCKKCIDDQLKEEPINRIPIVEVGDDDDYNSDEDSDSDESNEWASAADDDDDEEDLMFNGPADDDRSEIISNFGSLSNESNLETGLSGDTGGVSLGKLTLNLMDGDYPLGDGTDQVGSTEKSWENEQYRQKHSSKSSFRAGSSRGTIGSSAPTVIEYETYGDFRGKGKGAWAKPPKAAPPVSQSTNRGRASQSAPIFDDDTYEPKKKLAENQPVHRHEEKNDEDFDSDEEVEAEWKSDEDDDSD